VAEEAGQVAETELFVLQTKVSKWIP
jgi:hypothetical protein